MSTQKTNTQTNQFDPTSMNAFKAGTPAWSNQAINFAQNPYSNPQFQFERQMGTQNAQMQNQTGMNNLMQNMQTMGGGGTMSNSPMFQEMMANQMRGGTANTAQQGFYAPMQMAGQRQQNSMGMLAGYRPLQSGQTNVEKTSGLGTWLPQVLGAGMGIAGMAMGMPGGGGKGGGGGGSMWGPGSSSGWSGAGSPQMGNPTFQGFGSQAWNLGGPQGGPPPPSFGSNWQGGF